jgi:hypothetical protein
MKYLCTISWFVLMILLTPSNLNGQGDLIFEKSSHNYYQDFLVGDLLASTNQNYDTVIPLPAELSINSYRITSTKVIVKFFADWPKSALPTTVQNIPFNLSLSLQLYKGSRSLPFSENGSVELNINPNQPVSAYVNNFNDRVLGDHFIDVTNNSFYLDIELLRDITDNLSSGSSEWNDLLNTLKVSVEYIIEYGIDVSSEFFAPTLSKALIGNGRTIYFSWDNYGRDFPYYHFQLAKLDNIEFSNDENEQVTSNIDWSKSLNIFTETNSTSIELMIAEGTGFYVWRVRPIGSFFSGKEANARNFGRWSSENYPNANLSVIILTRTQAQSSDLAYIPFFYFSDPDKNLNYIYSRTYTEGNRNYEQISYANSLLQTKQIQSSIRSQQTTLLTQTVPDLIGRPALSSLPVPISGTNPFGFKRFVYQPRFMTTSPNNIDIELFTGWDYDTGNKVNNPSMVYEGSQSPFSYYSDINSDQTIPNAEGFPYSRTLYFNDGSGRVKEQSGVGKTHMISDEVSLNSGRTVKTFYATPSKTELIRIFGSEAPSSESVMKAITIDQNNTAQIVYTNRQGQNIATAVSFLENELPLSLSIPENSFNSFEVNDEVVYNVTTEEGFISTKRLAILKASPVEIDYSIKCNILQGLCVNTVIDCGYQLEIYLHDLIENNSELLHRQNIDANCDQDGEIKIDSTILRTLPPGNYLIEKKLLLAEPPQAQIAIAIDRIDEQIEPLTGLIYNWYNNLQTIEDIIAFKDQLEILKDDVMHLSSTDLKTKYNLPDEFEKTDDHYIYPIYTTITPPDGSQTFEAPTLVEVASSCCNITIPVGFVPDIVKPANDDYTPIEKNGSNGFQPNPYYFIQPQNTEFPLDLEGYSISFLRFSGCSNPEQILYGIPEIFIPEPLSRSFQHRIKNGELALMEGWERGDLNWMVYHMMMDEYTVDGSDATTPEIKRQYNFDDLIDCWTSILINLRDLACGGQDYGEPPYKVSENVDDADYEANNDPDETRDNEEIHDDHVDDEFGDLSWGMKLLLGIAGASGKVRDAQEQRIGGINPPGALYYPHHPIKQFLDCTSYKFAKIITPDDPCPLPQDAQSGRQYRVGNGAATTCPTDGTSMMKYNPRVSFSPKNQDEEFFPGVRDPHYAFKYFTYGYEQLGIDLKFPDLELITCFNDPNLCEDENGNSVPCCPNESNQLCNFCGIGIIECQQTYQDWSGGQRYSFFETIRNHVEQDINISSDFENIDCSDFLTEVYQADDANGRNWIRYQMDKSRGTCESACDRRRQIFKDSLIAVLERNCYVIGECRTDDPSQAYIIPVEDLDTLVNSMVEQCKLQCIVTTYRCIDTKQCRPINKSKRAYDPVADFITYRELEFGVGDPSDYTRDNCVQLSGSNAGIWQCNPAVEPPSYTETILRQQAMTWLPEISLPPMCNVNPDCDKQCPNSFSVNNTITDINDDEKDRIRSQAGKLYDPTGNIVTQPIKSDAVRVTSSVNSNN